MVSYRVRHYTEYDYQEHASVCYNRLCLTPLNISEQECIASDITITPTPEELNVRKDFFGNELAFFSIEQEHKKLRVNANSVVVVKNRVNADRAFRSTISWKDVNKKLYEEVQNVHDVIQYTLPSFYVPVSETIKNFSNDCFCEDDSLWNACNALMNKIHATIEFKPGFTTVNTPVESVIKLKKGVCQDFAHLMIACFRNYGLPARYVSGYLETVPPPGKEKLVGADASHAWVSVYFPDVGWVEFDPTNNLMPAYKHITVAYGRDYLDVAPIKGIVYSSGKQILTVKVDVERMS
jgi:transglutaminase-like putative cysteine protease